MHLILDEISNFFAAVLNIYPQIPRDLNQQIKTMQAFLRSYDQKQLFLIQNFVRRIEQKAQKVKNQQHKKRRHDLKTQPSLMGQDNKQNIYNMINAYRPGSIQFPVNENPFKMHLKDKSNQVKDKPKENQLDAEIKRYRMLFDNYSSGSRDNTSHMRPVSMPSQKKLSPLQLVSSRQVLKLNSSPYLQASQYVNSSFSSIEPNFHSIQIRPVPKEQKAESLEMMRRNIKELKEEMENDLEIRLLESCLVQVEE